MSLWQTVGFYMAIGGIAWSITTIAVCLVRLLDEFKNNRRWF